MNRGQAFYINDYNRVAAREEVVTAGVLALEFGGSRDPAKARKAIALSKKAKPYCRVPVPLRGEQALHKRERPKMSPPKAEYAGLIESLLGALRRARKNGAKLSLPQLLEVLEVPSERYRTTLRILNWLCAQGTAHRDGNKSSSLYWAE